MNFDWVNSLQALDFGRARSLEATVEEADDLVEAAIVNVRRELRASGEPPSIDQLFGRLSEVERARTVAAAIREFRDALLGAGKMGG